MSDNYVTKPLTMNIYGYSERGILNSLLYEILHTKNGAALLTRLIAKAKFPLTDKKPSFGAATILVEQSLSQFGDADAIVLISSSTAKSTIFVEAKVQSQSSDWLLSEQLSEFEHGLRSTVNSSNIFTQLYHKQRFISALKNNSDGAITALQKGIKFPSWSTRSKRSVGKNPVVLRAVKHIQQHADNIFYLMLVPDNEQRAETFFNKTLCSIRFPTVPEWDVSCYGYLTWATVKSFCEQNSLKETLGVFAYNKDQIFREK